MTDPEQLKFCHDTAKTASAIGFRVTEITAPGGTCSFQWLSPTGQKITSPFFKTRQYAFFGACRQLASHLASF